MTPDARPPADVPPSDDDTLVASLPAPPPPPDGVPGPGPERGPDTGGDPRTAAGAHPHPDESPAELALRRRRAERAREALVSPWSAARARRLRLLAVVLIIVGPILGSLFALVAVRSGASDQVEARPDEPPELAVKATVRSVDAATGEVSVRLVPTAPVDGQGDGRLFDGATLTEEVTLGVNDATGETVRVLPAGQTPGAITITVPLADSRVTRYPLDRYEAIVLVAASRAGAPDDSVPVDLTVVTNDPLFVASATSTEASAEASVVTLEVRRRATVVGWAVFFVVLCWMLAVSAASVGWVSVVWGVPAPVWCWAFLIGILFALPPLRDSLPGNPPGGSLVDFAAFYWAVGIVALTLVALAGSWNVRVRRWPDDPDAPRPPPPT